MSAMFEKRRKITVSLFSLLLRSIPRFSILGALTAFTEESKAVIDPATALALAQTAISVAKSFSSPSDGAMTAMLNAELGNQKLIIDQLQAVLQSLSSLSQFVVKFSEKVPEYFEASRVQTYFDQVRSGGQQFLEDTQAEAKAGAAERALYKTKYLKLQQDVQSARATLQQYSNIYSAVAIPLAMALEVALDYKTGYENLVPVSLHSYLSWCSSISNTAIHNSVASHLVQLIAEYDSIEAQIAQTPYGKVMGAKPGAASEGCYQTTACYLTQGRCHQQNNSHNTAYRPNAFSRAEIIKIRDDNVAVLECPEPTKNFGPTVKMRLFEVVTEAPNADGVKQLTVVSSAQSSFPEECPVTNTNDCHDWRTPEAALTNFIMGSAEWSSYASNSTTLHGLLEALNSKRQEIVIHINILVVTRQSTDNAIYRLESINAR
jgi:hypothetical protein